MATIRIAHLSDLHFGAHDAESVWALLTRHFADPDRRPHLVLFTGDLVDSPYDQSFALVHQAIESLCQFGQIPYFMRAGNHDRHFWGNTSSWKFWRRVERVIASSTRFFDEFGGRVASVNPPQTVSVGNWRVRIAGIASSVEADHFAH
jgi:DNA repair exonuclease SbcCD nuclease subunit